MFNNSKFCGIDIILLLVGVLGACASASDVFSVQGTVQAIERGKDGYTAVFSDPKGQHYNGVISSVNLAGTSNYQELTVGDKVIFYGDTTHLGSIISIKVSQIKK